MKVLITGGSGFLGARLIALLREPSPLSRDGLTDIWVYDPTTPRDPSLNHIEGDILDDETLRRALVGVDVVFHLAALVDWGREKASRLRLINVEGTRRVLEAARSAGVRAVVHTSSIDVVFTGRPIVDGDESLPYPARPPNGYCATKAEGERVALASDDPEGMRVCSVRPASVYGPGDPYHIGSLIELAAKGRLVRVGRGRARSQMVYVDNVAHIQILAAAKLLERGNDAGGKAFFVTDCPPANFFDFFAPAVAAAGFEMPPPKRGLPVAPLYAVGALFEAMAWLVRPVWRFAPKLTRFSIRFVTVDFTVSSDRARRELDYSPKVDDQEAMRRTCAHYERSGSHEERDQRSA